MFSKTCEYSIRALIYIAQQTKDGSKIGIKSIAKGIDSPEYFIAKILQELSREGFVKSIKGPNGGFYLSEQNKSTTLSEIVRHVDGNKLFESCVLGLKECSNEHPCPVHHQYKHVKSKIIEILESSILSDMAEKLDEELAYLKK
ncbi:MAG: Rrf2 family transcriptional regulator [Weeksellaceae bacterium]|jgi:Rrf2 family protein|nr:Rrf2 family transcriptional regulator [Weeksellaceae bacterium]